MPRMSPGPGALLGPEGAGHLRGGRPQPGCRWHFVPAAWETDRSSARTTRTCGHAAMSWDRARPYLENCTVDASIFVAKLLRAHGGCLGTRSRRRTWEAAISLGELPTEL